jgi:hypothetical protein
MKNGFETVQRLDEKSSELMSTLLGVLSSAPMKRTTTGNMHTKALWLGKTASLNSFQ